jgi:two-component system response regulator AtoC
MGPRIVLEWLEIAEWLAVDDRLRSAIIARDALGRAARSEHGTETDDRPAVNSGNPDPGSAASPTPRIGLAGRRPHIRRSSACPPSASAVVESSDQLPMEKTPVCIAQASGPTSYSPFLDGSPQMRAIRTVIENIADTDATVLIRGESGVGKDLVARAIHAASSRRHGPFVKVNCAAIPTELLESELFGHEKGAFTGAHRRKPGQFEYAHKGAIYLDEIAELPLAMQAKLLHVLQDFRFSRVGGHELLDVDMRVIAATNRNLEEAIACREFREDLYYRLNVVEIRVPPLRERREEIPELAARFLARFNAQYGRQKELLPETLARLTEHTWSGNVRELENVMRRLVVLADGEQAIEALVTRGRNGHNGHSGHGSAPRFTVAEGGLREIGRRGAREAQCEALREVLECVSWNRAEAARILKVSYKTLLTKIAECGLMPPLRR